MILYRNYGDVFGIIDGIQDGVTIPGSKNDKQYYKLFCGIFWYFVVLSGIFWYFLVFCGIVRGL